jgi:hypothetical protein
MSCSCIKKSYDVHISFTDCKTMVYEDQSDWMSGEAYEDRPALYEVRVYVPSKKKEYTLNLDPSKRNYITSVELFGTSEPTCLPDDIYCFSTESCGIDYQVNRAFVCRTECKIDELTTKAKSQDEHSEIAFFRNTVHSVKTCAKQGRPELAKELLEVLTKKLKHLLCASC